MLVCRFRLWRCFLIQVTVLEVHGRKKEIEEKHKISKIHSVKIIFLFLMYYSAWNNFTQAAVCPSLRQPTQSNFWGHLNKSRCVVFFLLLSMQHACSPDYEAMVDTKNGVNLLSHFESNWTPESSRHVRDTTRAVRMVWVHFSSVLFFTLDSSIEWNAF